MSLLACTTNSQGQHAPKYTIFSPIRHASDYDDFYIASKEESERQISVADEFIILAEKYCMEQLEKQKEN